MNWNHQYGTQFVKLPVWVKFDIFGENQIRNENDEESQETSTWCKDVKQFVLRTLVPPSEALVALKCYIRCSIERCNRFAVVSPSLTRAPLRGLLCKTQGNARCCSLLRTFLCTTQSLFTRPLMSERRAGMGCFLFDEHNGEIEFMSNMKLIAVKW